jgi:hypothetical protein
VPIALPEELAPLDAPLAAPVPPLAPDATEPVVDPVPLALPLLVPELVTPELTPVDPVPVPMSPDMAPVVPVLVTPEPPPVVPTPLLEPMEAPVLEPGIGLSLLQATATRRVDQQIAQTKARGFILHPRGARQTRLRFTQIASTPRRFSGCIPCECQRRLLSDYGWEAPRSQVVKTIAPP